MYSYHITITMPNAHQGVHVGLYPHAAAAAMRAASLFPDAAKISVLRLLTVLLRGYNQTLTARCLDENGGAL